MVRRTKDQTWDRGLKIDELVADDSFEEQDEVSEENVSGAALEYRS